MGDNLATIRAIEASNFVKPYTPDRVLDGSTKPVSRWLCNSPSGWLCADLGVATPINGYSVTLMGAAGWNAAFNFCNIALHGSNDKVNWAGLDSFTNNQSNNVVTRTFNTAVFRYVRLSISSSLSLNNKVASVVNFQIAKAPVSANLTGLTISSGTLNPAFTSAGTSYTVNVPNSVASVTLTPTAQDANATIMVGINKVASGQASPAINLNVGENTVAVQVTGVDGVTKQTYTVIVNRAKSMNLVSLAVSEGTLSPVFDGDTTAYTVNVPYKTTSITMMPFAQDSGAVITVNGQSVASGTPSQGIGLNVGNNSVTIVVSIDGNQKVYSVNVVRASSPYLTGVKISNIMLQFNPNILKYEKALPASLPNNGITITPKAEDPNAIIKIKYVENNVPKETSVASEQPSLLIPIVSGLNVIFIVVSSVTGTDKEQYEFYLTK